jgi:VanZ family protein
MSGLPGSGSNRRYWTGVGAYVFLLLLVQSVMGLGIDKFKELFGTGTLEVLAYAIVAAGASGVVWTGWKVWGRCSAGDRAWIGLALLIYGAGTLSARNPQERLHYLGYGLLAALLYVGFARARSGITAPGGGPGFVPAAFALLIGALIGYADELLQILWPRRYFDWADVGMNVVAVALGLLVAVPAWRALGR